MIKYKLFILVLCYLLVNDGTFAQSFTKSLCVPIHSSVYQRWGLYPIHGFIRVPRTEKFKKVQFGKRFVFVKQGWFEDSILVTYQNSDGSFCGALLNGNNKYLTNIVSRDFGKTFKQCTISVDVNSEWLLLNPELYKEGEVLKIREWMQISKPPKYYYIKRELESTDFGHSWHVAPQSYSWLMKKSPHLPEFDSKNFQLGLPSNLDFANFPVNVIVECKTLPPKEKKLLI